MLTHRLVLSSLLALCAGDLASQTQKVVFLDQGNATATGANTFPWSRQALRYQTIFPSAKFSTSGAGAWVINDIMVAPQFAASRPQFQTAVYDDIEIRMGPTPLATPVNDWAKNNPNPTVVYRGPLRVTFEQGQWRGMGLPNSYLFLQTPPAPNLCVEFIMWKFNPTFNANTIRIRTVTTPNVRRAYYFNWTQSQTTAPSVDSLSAEMGLLIGDGNFVVTEVGCRSSNGLLAIGASTYPQSGKPIDITMTGGVPNGLSLLAVGASDVRGFGTNLPIDAAPFGAPGCFIWNENTFTVPTVADATGAAKLTFMVPAGNARAYVHWWHNDPQANALGWATSNYGKILLGN